MGHKKWVFSCCSTLLNIIHSKIRLAPTLSACHKTLRTWIWYRARESGGWMADEIRYYIVECLLGLTTVKIINALLMFLTLFLCVLSHPELYLWDINQINQEKIQADRHLDYSCLEFLWILKYETMTMVPMPSILRRNGLLFKHSLCLKCPSQNPIILKRKRSSLTVIYHYLSPVPTKEEWHIL